MKKLRLKLMTIAIICCRAYIPLRLQATELTSITEAIAPVTISTALILMGKKRPSDIPLQEHSLQGATTQRDTGDVEIGGLPFDTLYKTKELQNKAIQIFCKNNIDGSTLVLALQPTDTLWQLKEHLYLKTGIPIIEQTLTLANKLLYYPYHTLGQYPIGEATTLDLSLSIVGGGKDEWDENGIHKKTGRKYDPEGYNMEGHDIFGWTRQVNKLDEEKIFSIIIDFYQKKEGVKGILYDNVKDVIRKFCIEPEWTLHGMNKITKSWYDKGGFDINGWDMLGIHKDTNTNYNQYGFNKYGRHRDTGTRYDKDGYDTRGYNKDGWHKGGWHKDTGTRYDSFNYPNFEKATCCILL